MINYSKQKIQNAKECFLNLIFTVTFVAKCIIIRYINCKNYTAVEITMPTY